MRRPDLNLAAKPFVNRRPVSRLSWGLWILGAILLLVNVNAYRGYFSGSDEKVAEIEALDQKIKTHEATIQELKSSLLAMDLTQQNEQVDFLNRKIAERTFSWSHLFDQLEEVLPDDVRISSLTPKVTEFSKTRREADANEVLGDRVSMSIVAVAKTVDAQLDFVDGFFQHPSFEQPRLSSDSQTATGSRFNLSVLYRPVRLGSEQMADGSDPLSAARGNEESTGLSSNEGSALAATVPGQASDRRRPLGRGLEPGSALADSASDATTLPSTPASGGAGNTTPTRGSLPEATGGTQGAGTSGAARSGAAARGGGFGVPGAVPGAGGTSTPSAGARGRSGSAGSAGTGQPGGSTRRGAAGGQAPTPAAPEPTDEGTQPSGRIPSASSTLEPQ